MIIGRDYQSAGDSSFLFIASVYLVTLIADSEEQKKIGLLDTLVPYWLTQQHNAYVPDCMAKDHGFDQLSQTFFCP